MLLAGRRTHKNEAFLSVRGGFYEFGLREVKMLWVGIMGITLVQVTVFASLLPQTSKSEAKQIRAKIFRIERCYERKTQTGCANETKYERLQILPIQQVIPS
jgi:hypothetical protein